MPSLSLNILINFDDFDFIVFTSKNAIKAIDSFDNSWKNTPALVIAPNTAKVVKKHGGKVEFVGTKSYGDEFAIEILDIVKDKKVLFLRAAKVMSKLYDILKKHDIDIIEKIIYETTILNLSKSLQPPPNSTIIFSSPSTISGFLDNFLWHSSYKAVAIGKTTVNSLPSYIKHTVAKTPSLKDAIDTARCYT